MNITAYKNKAILTLSIALGLIFFGFNAAEQHFTAYYQSIGLSNLAFQSLALLYGSILIGNFLGPTIIKRFGVTKSFFFGYLTYVALVLGITLKIPLLVYFLSFLLGIGAGVAGIAFTEFLRLIAPKEKRGEYSSATETLRIFGGFFGIALVSLILKFISIDLTFLLLGIIMLIGVFILLTIRKLPESKQKITTPQQDIKDLFPFLLDIRVLLLLPKSVASGFLLGLILGAVPVIIGKNFGIGWVGIVTSLWHMIIASLTLWAGYLSDIKGRFGLIYASLAIPIAATFIVLNFQTLPILALVMILLGIGDSLGKGASVALSLDIFEDQIKEASAVLGNLSIIIGVVPSFLLPQVLNQTQLFAIAIGLTILGIISLFIFQIKYYPPKTPLAKMSG